MDKIDPREVRLFLREQEQIRDYVLLRPLPRPKTNFLNILFLIAAYTLVSSLLGLGLTAFLPISNCTGQILSFALCFIMFIRFFCIKLIECYQHYAKASIRRKCLCKPTCSEYAILALKKHSLPVAVVKIYIRLFHRCKGGIYIKDPI